MIIVGPIIDGLTIRGVVVVDLDVDVTDVSDIDMMIDQKKKTSGKITGGEDRKIKIIKVSLS